MLKQNTECRICKGKRLTKVISMGSQPLANGFLKGKEDAKGEPFFPLDVYFCHDCNLAQLIDIVDKEVLFRDYVYFTSGMPRISDHFRKYAEDVMKKYLTNKKDLVVELGSNDGILLAFFRENGFSVMGVDPARNIAKVAEARGVPTICDFFGEKVAEKIVKEQGKAKAILANNVVAHINDHHGLMKGIHTLMAEDGVFIVEAPYLVDMFENLTYDTIYHEHLSYLAIRPLMILAQQYGMEVFDAEIVPTFSQSIRVCMGRQGKHKITEAVAELIQKEKEFGLDQLSSYQGLARRIEKSNGQLVALLKDFKKQQKKIAAYGAPAKGNTLLNYGKIGTDILDYALDHLPSKQGLFSPGLHIPVVDEKYARENPPDYYLLLAWNYIKPILEREKDFVENGGKFIIPVGDEIKIV